MGRKEDNAMAEEKTTAEALGRYASYPEGMELLLRELKFPVEDETVKRMLLQTTISSLLHY